MPSLNKKIEQSIQRVYKWMIKTQTDEGTWPEPYDGPLFLLPLYIFALRICNRTISPEAAEKMSKYIYNHQLDDGSFGLHQESKTGTLFTSIINYIALRFLGHEAIQPGLINCRRWIHENGGPLYSANWCKFILSFLNLYSYRGVSPLPPELYLLPAWFPFHPRKIGGFTRVIYLPMCYLYRRKYALQPDRMIFDLRKELYRQPFDEINFNKHRHTFSDTDNINPETRIFQLTMRLVELSEYLLPGILKKKALNRVYSHIVYEDENSNFIRQAPINAVYNTLVYHFKGESENLERSWNTLPGYLWEDSNQILMQGYTNTFTWDCGFYLKGLASERKIPELQPLVNKTRTFLLENQVLSELKNPNKYHRIQRSGGWAFSDNQNGWVVSDCTAESITGLLLTEDYDSIKISDKNLNLAIDFLLSIQNKDGGWSSIDKAIGNPKLEWFNASNLFVDIMVDHSFVECSSSVIQAMMAVKQARPHLINSKVISAVDKAVSFLLQSQRNDGSWEGAWGICFTYSTYFAVEALKAYGIEQHSEIIQRACEYLWSKQRKDGGWGEAQETALARNYIQADQSIVDQTAWAIITLLNGGHANDPSLIKAVNWMISQQQEDGDWPVQPITGLFYKTTMISYRNYRRYFPLIALKMYKKHI